MSNARRLADLLESDGDVLLDHLDNVPVYSLPTAAASTLGGIKVGTNLSIDGAGVLSSTDNDTTYSVGDGGLTEKNFTTALDTKLTNIETAATADQTDAEIKTAYEANADTNEFSDAEQTKLSGIATSANLYVHPTSAGDKHIPTGGASGQFLKYSSSGTAAWAVDNDTVYTHPSNHAISVITGLQTALDAKTTPGYVDTAISNLIGAAPAALDTLQELGDAIGDDANYAATITTALSGKVANSRVLTDVPASALFTDTTYSVGDAGLTEKNFTSALNTKLTNIETSATADQTNAEIKTAYEANADTNEFSDAEQTKLSGIATSANLYVHPVGAGDKHIPTGGSSGQFLKYSSSGTAIWAADNDTTYSVGDAGLTEKNFTSAFYTKLTNIETSATADQTNAEIKTAYEANADTNEFSDAEQTKLSGIATSANLYVHPTGDGNKHVPADSGSSTGKILTATTTAGSPTWQPAPVSLPSQTGENGKYLSTDGSSASWNTVSSNSTSEVLFEHKHTYAGTYSITSGNNAISTGPITISPGGSVTVPPGSAWLIVA